MGNEALQSKSREDRAFYLCSFVHGHENQYIDNNIGRQLSGGVLQNVLWKDSGRVAKNTGFVPADDEWIL